MIIRTKNCAPLLAGALSALLLVGCTDDSYDLSDIDTTAQIEVKDLTIPLNLSPVTFESMVSLKDEECVEVTADGDYAIVQTGDFEETINIKRIMAYPRKDIDVVHQTVPYVEGQETDIDEHEFPFSYANQSDMDKYITKLESGKVDFDMNMQFRLNDIYGPVDFRLYDMKFRAPKGFYGTYAKPDGTTGRFDANNNIILFNGAATRRGEDGNGFDFVIHVDEIDVAVIESEELGHIDYKTGYVEFSGSFDVVDGRLKVTGANNFGVQDATLDIDMHLGDMEFLSFTGNVKYELDEIAEQHVDLSSLPKVLRDPETNIELINPQIYIQLTNPLWEDGFTGDAGLKLTQERAGVDPDRSYYAEMDGRLTLAAVDGKQNFVICPDPAAVTSYPEGWEITNPHKNKMEMPGLGGIIKGDGLPQGLNLDFDVPTLKEHHVVDFALNHDYGKVEGKYEFYAPLRFKEGSKVLYQETQDGWDFGTDEDLEISKMDITATLKSEMPVAVGLEAAPIDEDGNPLPGIKLDVEPKTIPAGYDGTVSIKLTGGVIEKLYGMQYTVRLVAGQDEKALRPDQKLILDNIRAKVSGKYVIKDTDDDDDSSDDYYYNY